MYQLSSEMSREKCMSHEKKKSIHYVNNQKLAEEISKYRESVEKAQKEGKPEPRIPDYIGKCIWDIAEKLSTKPCFINYSFRDEMVSDGIENCFLYFKDYDPNFISETSAAKGTGPNPFAYFTQIIYYAFIRRINKEEKNRYILYKNFYRDWETDRKSTRLNSSHSAKSRMPSSA